jgi:hypothetical protein
MKDKKTIKSKLISKALLKKSNITVSIPEYKAPSILGDENRFFKGEMAREKKAMFFS